MSQPREILGYLRPDGQIGIRNNVAIIYSVDCSMVVAQKLHDLYPIGTQIFGVPYGCPFNEPAFNKMVAYANHSSFAGALVVGLGCEGTDASMMAEEIAKSGKPVEAIKIQNEDGDLKAIEKGSRILMRLLQHASVEPRAILPPSDLVIGMKCGGSDPTSGLSSNPLVGAIADMHVDNGGTYIHAEVNELMGCAEVLAERAVDEVGAQQIRAALEERERLDFQRGRFSLTYGNILSGLTTIEEKSYGALCKSGTKPLQGVLTEFKRPPRRGYWILYTQDNTRTFFGDPETINQIAACGAHLCLFTSGCGSTAGGFVPVIKVLSNPHRPQLIADNVDFDGSPVILGQRTIADMAPGLYAEIMAVAAGKLTKSEIHRHFEA